MAAQERQPRPLPSVVVIFRTNQDESEVLLVRHGPKVPRKEGIYGFPGGRPKTGESAEEAAIREFREETGLEIAPDNLIPFPGEENVYTGTNQRNNRSKPYAIKAYSVRNPDEVGGVLRKTHEAIPVWAKIRTLNRRRALLMGSVQQIISESKTTKND
jgi:8-oxo-dGTP pyrophosphatase MutT (NUDIX family)